MVKPIVKDVFFLGQKSEPAIKLNLSFGQDLMDTLRANQDHCGGMAANMIGFKKRIIKRRNSLLTRCWRSEARLMPGEKRKPTKRLTPDTMRCYITAVEPKIMTNRPLSGRTITGGR